MYVHSSFSHLSADGVHVDNITNDDEDDSADRNVDDNSAVE
jgi:hypothetical protein